VFYFKKWLRKPVKSSNKFLLPIQNKGPGFDRKFKNLLSDVKKYISLVISLKVK